MVYCISCCAPAVSVTVLHPPLFATCPLILSPCSLLLLSAHTAARCNRTVGGRCYHHWQGCVSTGQAGAGVAGQGAHLDFFPAGHNPGHTPAYTRGHARLLVVARLGFDPIRLWRGRYHRICVTQDDTAACYLGLTLSAWRARTAVTFYL